MGFFNMFYIFSNIKLIVAPRDTFFLKITNNQNTIVRVPFIHQKSRKSEKQTKRPVIFPGEKNKNKINDRSNNIFGGKSIFRTKKNNRRDESIALSLSRHFSVSAIL